MAGTQTKQSKPDFIPATWKRGYMHTPQAIRDLLSRERVSGAIQLQILLEVNGRQADATKDGAFSAWARGLTMSALAIACGRKRDQVSGVEKAVADLVTRGLLAKEPDGKTWLDKGKLCARAWKYQIAPNAWHAAPKYVPVDEDDESVTADEAEGDEKKSAGPTWLPGTIVMMPGKMTRAVTLRDAVGRVRFTSELPDALGCEIGSTESGELHVRLFAKPADAEPVEKAGCEEKAKVEKSVGVSPAAATNVLPDARTGVRASKQVKSGGQSPAPPASPPDELAEFLAKHATPITGSVVPADILARVRENLNGTPLDFLATKIDKRRRALSSNGLLPGLAADAREAYHATRAHEPPPENLDPLPQPRWDGYKSWAGDREHWHELDEKDREFYRRARPEETAELDAKGGIA